MERRDFLKCLGSAAVISASGALKADERSSDLPSKATLPTRVLGKSGVKVSALALGGVIGMQKALSKELDPSRLAETALDMGITYFDTAAVYGAGQSERNFGKVMARRRGEVFLTTKTSDRTYDGTMRSIEASLKRLQTDHVDLLQVHSARRDEDVAVWGKPNGVVAALQKLRDQKVTRLIGVTGHENADVLRRAIEMYEFDTHGVKGPRARGEVASASQHSVGRASRLARLGTGLSSGTHDLV